MGEAREAGGGWGGGGEVKKAEGGRGRLSFQAAAPWETVLSGPRTFLGGGGPATQVNRVRGPHPAPRGQPCGRRPGRIRGPPRPTGLPSDSRMDAAVTSHVPLLPVFSLSGSGPTPGGPPTRAVASPRSFHQPTRTLPGLPSRLHKSRPKVSSHRKSTRRAWAREEQRWRGAQPARAPQSGGPGSAERGFRGQIPAAGRAAGPVKAQARPQAQRGPHRTSQEGPQLRAGWRPNEPARGESRAHLRLGEHSYRWSVQGTPRGREGASHLCSGSGV